jgi:hypothetical protein
MSKALTFGKKVMVIGRLVTLVGTLTCKALVPRGVIGWCKGVNSWFKV